MKIDSYSFGRIVIDGTEHTSDVIIYPDRLDAPWWRKEGHLLAPEDLSEVFAYSPKVLVIGTGYNGVMAVPPKTVEAVQEKGIEVHIARTGDAVKLFNRLQREHARIVAALHLTC
jgi:hypothetical protein